MTVREIITYNLRNLLNFSGRDSRRVFWIYVGIMTPLVIVIFQIGMAPFFLRGMAERKAIVKAAIQSGQQVLPPNDSGQFFIWVTIACAAFIIILLAAAVTRRLHDLGRSGTWACIPALLLILGLLGFQSHAGQGGQFSMFFVFVVLSMMAYQLSLFVLLFFLSKPGSTEENRYGQSRPPAQV